MLFNFWFNVERRSTILVQWTVSSGIGNDRRRCLQTKVVHSKSLVKVHSRRSSISQLPQLSKLDVDMLIVMHDLKFEGVVHKSPMYYISFIFCNSIFCLLT